MIQHCRKALHSRTRENPLVNQIQKALWRKFKPLVSRNKNLYTLKEVKENALSSEGKSCRPKTKTTMNRCVPWPLSLKQVAKTTLAQWKCTTFRGTIYPREEKNVPPFFIAIKSAALWRIECEIRRRRWRIRIQQKKKKIREKTDALAGFPHIRTRVRVARNARARNLLGKTVANWCVNSFDSRIQTWQKWAEEGR